MRGFRLAATMVAASAAACSDGPAAPRAEDFPDEPAPSPHPEVVTFVDVTVITMDGDRAASGQTVIVRGDRIEALGPVEAIEVPPKAFRIEGQGRYLMPGLADMHVHLTSGTFANLRNDFVLFLANGVTTTRVMWGSRGLVAERDRIRDGEVMGPDLLVASPGLDAPGGTWTASTPPVGTPSDARARVAEHAQTGYDFIKVYNDLAPDVYEAIVSEAVSSGIPVVGHVPWRVGIERVLAAGQLTLEHFIGYKLAASSPPMAGTLDLPRVRELATRAADAGAWHTPTITVDALSRDQVRGTRSSPEIHRVSPGMRAFFENGFYHGFEASVAAREEANQKAIVRAVHEAGGRLLVGTDAGFGWIVPGYSIHDELGRFVDSGLTPYEALRAATADAARSVGLENEFGRIAPGLRADLMLVATDPLRELDALLETSGVMSRGRWLSRGTLTSMLEGIEAAYREGPG